MDDDLYPSDGGYFMPREPQEQVIARKKEQAQTLEALKIIEQVIKHFEDRIKFRDSVESINVDIEKDPSLHQKVFQTHKLLKEALIEEKQLLEDLLETHDKR